MLGILLLEADRVVSVDRLADLLWAGERTAGTRAAIQTYVSRLRSVLVPHGVRILTSAAGYRLRVDPQTVDVHQLLSMLSEQSKLTDVLRRMDVLESALARYRGPLLDGTAPAHLAIRVGPQVEEARWSALEQLAELHLTLGRPDQAVSLLRDVAVGPPFRERMVWLVMSAYLAMGRRAEALSVYQSVRTSLAHELGLEPSASLRQLQRTILRDPPRSAADGGDGPVRPGPLLRRVPPPPSVLLGRDAELRRLVAALTEESTTGRSLVTVSGPGGVGKTALAVVAVREVMDRFPGGILYADMQAVEDPVDVARVLGDFLVVLGVAQPLIPPTRERRADLLRAIVATRPAVAVLDNMTDASQLSEFDAALTPSPLVVISRRRLDLPAARESIDLGPLDPDASIRLLAVAAGADRIAADPRSAARIASLCGHLPLALHVVAARIAAHDQLSLRSSANDIADERDRLDRLSAGRLDFRACLSLSFRELAAEDRLLMGRLAILAMVDFPVWIPASLADRSDELTAGMLTRLVQARLLNAVPDESGHCRYSFHDLVRLYARERASADEAVDEQVRAFRRVLDAWARLGAATRRLYFASPPPVTALADLVRAAPAGEGAAQVLARLDADAHNLPHLINQAIARGEHVRAWQIPYLLFGYFDSGHRMQDAVECARLAVRATAELGDLAAQRIMYGHYAALCRSQDQAAAMDALHRVVEIARTTDAQDAEAFAHVNLGNTLNQLQRFDEALSMYAHAEQILSRLKDTNSLAMLYNNMATSHAGLGDLAAAVGSCADSIRLAHSAGNRDALARASTRMAWYLQHSDPAAAHRLLDEAHEIAEHLGLVTIELDIRSLRALMLVDAGAVPASFALLEETMQLSRDTQSPVEQAQVHATIGLALLRLGDADAAAAKLRDVDQVRGLPERDLPLSQIRALFLQILERPDDAVLRHARLPSIPAAVAS